MRQYNRECRWGQPFFRTLQGRPTRGKSTHEKQCGFIHNCGGYITFMMSLEARRNRRRRQCPNYVQIITRPQYESVRSALNSGGIVAGPLYTSMP